MSNIAEANLNPLRNTGKPKNLHKHCQQRNETKDAIQDHGEQRGCKKRQCCDKDQPVNKRRMSDVDPTQTM
ncbi:hypothetical protein L5515_009118 [Caenorhabditis briggsae]|uniref:Uncharacterized protein n=1 Tax=Caenorhabditis briggsae TaxID=6238 RepID=A0AAE9F900_CAEBR|nr:hypothetical protein L5515_009118 [Caenorhabditis briggsae]